MIEYFKKHPTRIVIFFILILLVAFLFFPAQMKLISKVMFLMSTYLAIAVIFQKYWKSYQLAEYTREKMLHTLLLDLLGLLCAMAAALYAGWLAGGYFGLHVGFWLGLLAGFAGGFSAAWAVRWAWGILVKVEA